MSTIFGILRKGKAIKLINDTLPADIEDDLFIEVAFQRNGGDILWRNELAPFLPNNTKVYPLDNSAQGIYNIHDLKTLINKQK